VILTLSAEGHKILHFYTEGWLQGSCCNYFVILAALKLDSFSKGYPNTPCVGGRYKTKDESGTLEQSTWAKKELTRLVKRNVL